MATPGYCAAHRTSAHRDYSRARRRFDREVGFYQSTRWRAVRAAYLRAHPTCRACAHEERWVPSVVVDHIQPIKENGARYDARNLQALCVSCHNRKSARERVSSLNRS